MTALANPTPSDVSPVYMSGPMFSAADLCQQYALAKELENNSPPFATYLPPRDGIEVGKVMGMVNNANSPEVAPVLLFVRQIVFCMDMYQVLARCQSLVLNMDGRVPDEGSVSETSAAFTAGVPIVIYKTTPISMLGGQDNPMVSGLSMNWKTVSDVTDLPAAILAAAEAAESMGGTRFRPGKQCSAVITLGSAVWENMPTIRKILENADPTNPAPTVDALLALKQAWKAMIAAAFPDAPQLSAV
jgi:hypothetical protein